MAEKFAVYSTDAALVSLGQGLRLGKSLSLPEWIEGMLAGGTFTIPDSGSADAADSVVVYMVECASGTASRTIVLPANPRDGQVLVLKDANAGRSNVVIQGAGVSDTIDGATSYTLLYDNQAVVLRAQTYVGQVLWSILSEHRPVTAQANWGNPLNLTTLGATSVYLDVGSSVDNAPSSIPKLIYLSGRGRVLSFSASVLTGLIASGDVTVNLQQNGVTRMTLGPYTTTDPGGFYSTSTGAFNWTDGDSLDVQVVIGGTPSGTSAAYAVVRYTFD